MSGLKTAALIVMWAFLALFAPLGLVLMMFDKGHHGSAGAAMVMLAGIGCIEWIMIAFGVVLYHAFN